MNAAVQPTHLNRSRERVPEAPEATNRAEVRLVEKPISDDILRHDERWFVGQTLPRKENLARMHLERQGFKTFLPRILSTRRHAHKFEAIKAVMFPGYLFVHLDPTRDRWRSIRGTIGMAYLLTVGERPCPVPVGFVEGLQQAGGADDLIKVPPDLEPGDAVRLTAGPFAGQVGELLRFNAKGRVDMLLDLLNGSVRLRVAREFLEPAT